MGVQGAAQDAKRAKWRSTGTLRTLGLGLITGAADDDPSAIGTYAAAGSKLGPSFLWIAPFTLPMMYAVVYLSAKLGQVTGEGLFGVIRENYPKLTLPLLALVVLGNIFEAGADLGGMAASVGLLLPVSYKITVVAIAAVLLALQIWGSYQTIRKIFRWLALTLMAYVGASLIAKPQWGPVLQGTFVPHLEFSREFMSLLVAAVGTTLSAYLYTWKSNEEVEEKIEAGLRTREERRGTTEKVLKKTRLDVLLGMAFSNLITYFIILSTASTLYRSGQHEVNSAAQAAEALRPIAGPGATVLFALGVVGVGFLAIPVMTTGAAYDIAQTFKWKHGLHKEPGQANRFHLAIAAVTVVAVLMNFLGLNPMKVLVWAGIVQGFSTPPLMLLIMLMTSSKRIMGEKANGRGILVLGWLTTAVIFATSIGLIVTWFI